jgi:hypothetical protein
MIMFVDQALNEQILRSHQTVWRSSLLRGPNGACYDLLIAEDAVVCRLACFIPERQQPASIMFHEVLITPQLVDCHGLLSVQCGADESDSLLDECTTLCSIRASCMRFSLAFVRFCPFSTS